MIKEMWYLNSGCSQYMTGNKSILTNLQVSNQDSVIFDDGAKGRIIGTSSSIIPTLYGLKDVFLVEGIYGKPDQCKPTLRGKCSYTIYKGQVYSTKPKPLSSYGRANYLI